MNADTKRHIDAARQVLVGVVPNPTSQIDQITNALIYKFMDDMDQSAIKQGGDPSFFVKDLKNYSWTRLMDARIGNQERMNIYGEALVKFSESKQLPQLFREIFKSAFLPYRSPEVLGLFLKEIDYFDYSHSEELGNAYEYLLSIMSSQGDAGQFRTPRHIIDFMVNVVDPSMEDKVLDPSCGTGGFLVSAYKHILEQHDGKDDPKKKEKPLTPDQRKNLMGNFEGYDVDPGMVRIAQVNMYLHQFKNPKIYNYDTLSMEERWGDKFSVILANPPFMSPKGGVSTHKKFSIQSTRSEVLFVDYIIEHLNINGKAGIVVPDGIVANPSNLYAKLRELAIENGLYAVVSLHNTVFKPYAGAKTSVLFFDKAFAKKSKDIIFIKINNDGYEKGEQRRKIEQNDIPEVVKLIADFKSGNKALNSEIDFIIVPREQLNKKFSLFVNKYLISNRENGNESVEISTLFDIQKGTLQSTKKTEGEFDFITAAQEWSTHNSYTHDCEALIFAFGAAGSLGRTHYVNGKFIASDLCFILTLKKDSKSPVNLSFYHAYFNAIREQIVADLAKGVSKLAINKTEFSNYLIDYVAIEKQNDFGNKIVAEQKKIAEMKAKIEESEESIKEIIFEIL